MSLCTSKKNVPIDGLAGGQQVVVVAPPRDLRQREPGGVTGDLHRLSLRGDHRSTGHVRVRSGSGHGGTGQVRVRSGSGHGGTGDVQVKVDRISVRSRSVQVMSGWVRSG